MFHLTNHEVFVISSRAEGRDGAQIATWVIPVTLVPDRMRVAVAMSPRNHTFSLVQRSGRMVLHLLAEGQEDLLPRLGLLSARDRPDKLSGIPWERTASGLPRLPGTCGSAELVVVDRLDSGDRVILLCDALEIHPEPDRPPLRHKDALSRLPPEVVQALADKRLRDGDRDRALFRDYGTPPPQSTGPGDLR
ncbi:MAG TPA: flavin reductase family protein [Myxococcota bacterium]|nr:flavin reductase family protein [Myxococcota bacterium]HQK50211.1 flavin reductase family protein [Myxococcota bacterium]